MKAEVGRSGRNAVSDGQASPHGSGNRLTRLARAVVRQAIAPAAAARYFDRPIFVLAPPRSGSSFLFECLGRFEETVFLAAEADLFWWQRFPYGREGGYSDHVPLGSLTASQGRALCRSLYRHAVINGIRQRSLPPSPGHLLGLVPIRYLDKTIANCFHLEVLERLFPTAAYVHLVRDPRANIASMIEGWPQLHRFGKPQLTPVVRAIERRRIEHWTYPAPPGWQRVVDRPIHEICAWSWQQHVESVLDFFESRPRRPIRVSYEQLVEDPATTVRQLGAALGLRWSEEVERYARAAPLSRTTLSLPNAAKWRTKHQAEIEAVLPMIRATAQRVGYTVASTA